MCRGPARSEFRLAQGSGHKCGSASANTPQNAGMLQKNAKTHHHTKLRLSTYWRPPPGRKFPLTAGRTAQTVWGGRHAAQNLQLTLKSSVSWKIHRSGGKQGGPTWTCPAGTRGGCPPPAQTSRPAAPLSKAADHRAGWRGRRKGPCPAIAHSMCLTTCGL